MTPLEISLIAVLSGFLLAFALRLLGDVSDLKSELKRKNREIDLLEQRVLKIEAQHWPPKFYAELQQQTT